MLDFDDPAFEAFDGPALEAALDEPAVEVFDAPAVDVFDAPADEVSCFFDLPWCLGINSATRTINCFPGRGSKGLVDSEI